jgi:hypothetical protein
MEDHHNNTLYCLSCCSCPAGYSAAIVFTIICMLLYNVQQDIEQPFDVSTTRGSVPSLPKRGCCLVL